MLSDAFFFVVFFPLSPALFHSLAAVFPRMNDLIAVAAVAENGR